VAKGQNNETLWEKRMNAMLDASVQLIQVGLLLILIALNFGVRRRLKAIEEKLGR
jgi:hypothetical protein